MARAYFQAEPFDEFGDTPFIVIVSIESDARASGGQVTSQLCESAGRTLELRCLARVNSSV